MFELFATWQSVLLALATWLGTEGIKRCLDFFLGAHVIISTPPPALNVEVLSAPFRSSRPSMLGREKRRQNVLLNRVVLPAVPVALGTVGALIIPMRPEQLHEYAATFAPGQELWVFGTWGAVVGGFSDYAYSKITKLIEEARP